MSKRCNWCGIQTIFYVWSTSRNFPVGKYLKERNIIDKGGIREVKYQGHPICFRCFNKLKK